MRTLSAALAAAILASPVSALTSEEQYLQALEHPAITSLHNRVIDYVSSPAITDPQVLWQIERSGLPDIHLDYCQAQIDYVWYVVESAKVAAEVFQQHPSEDSYLSVVTATFSRVGNLGTSNEVFNALVYYTIIGFAKDQETNRGDTGAMTIAILTSSMLDSQLKAVQQDPESVIESNSFVAPLLADSREQDVITCLNTTWSDLERHSVLYMVHKFRNQ